MKKYRVGLLDQGEIYGGAEMFHLEVLENISKEQWDVFVVASSHMIETYQSRVIAIPDIHITTLPLASLAISPKSMWSFFKMILQIRRIVKKNNIQLLHSNTARMHIVSSIVSKWTKVPLVWMVHDTTIPVRLLPFLTKFPSHIFCVSDIIVSWIKNHTPATVHHKLSILPNGVDISLVEKEVLTAPIKDNRRKTFGFRKDTSYIGIMGRVDIGKGQDVFIKAIKILLTDYPAHQKFHGLIIGGETLTSLERKAYVKSLKQYIKKEGLEAHVTFLGHQELRFALLKKLSILVQASTFPEPFGRTLIEGFHAGVPVIASKIGAMATMITYGVNGLVFEPGNPRDLAQKISLLLEDNHLAETLRTNARIEARLHYTLKNVLERLQKEWFKTIKSSKS